MTTALLFVDVLLLALCYALYPVWVLYGFVTCPTVPQELAYGVTYAKPRGGW